MISVKLWYAPDACSLAAHTLLHEAGAAFETVRVSLADGEHLAEAFTRINPKKRVPVLALDDAIVTELPAIALAIAQMAPDRHLAGRAPLDQVRVQEWMNWLSGTLHAQGFGALWRPQRFSDDPAMHPSISAKGLDTIAECFQTIERRLSDTHAVGGAFTMVDAFLLVFHRWGGKIGINMQAYPRFTRNAAATAARPAAVAALATEAAD